MAYVIAEPCVNTKDTACVEVCPVDCIHPKKDEAEFAAETKLYIDPETCIDCGACVPVCPVQAIFPLEELPEKWAHFTQMDADWYAQEVAASAGRPSVTARPPGAGTSEQVLDRERTGPACRAAWRARSASPRPLRASASSRIGARRLDDRRIDHVPHLAHPDLHDGLPRARARESLSG